MIMKVCGTFLLVLNNVKGCPSGVDHKLTYMSSLAFSSRAFIDNDSNIDPVFLFS